MTTASLGLVTALFFAGAATAAQAQASPVGDWSTHHFGSVVRVSACGDALCGKVVTSDPIKTNPNVKDERNADPALRGRPLKDLPVFYGVKGGPTEWKGGSVYNPEDGKTYHGSITLVDADTLKLTGCIIYPLCKSQTWTRVK
jgi:uncharacterized protein (DUF2147 family)